MVNDCLSASFTDIHTMKLFTNSSANVNDIILVTLIETMTCLINSYLNTFIERAQFHIICTRHFYVTIYFKKVNF